MPVEPKPTAAEAPDVPSALLSIGQLSRMSGVSVRAIRHYDELGLLASLRADNGYRKFRAGAAVQVRQIQRFLSTGFNLEEIRRFPGCMLVIEGALPCAETSPAQRERLALIEAQIADLERRRAQLLQMLSHHDDEARAADHGIRASSANAPPPRTTT
ncbi:MAG: MerR family DNA-binding transcriptional regulator [Rubrivivax sp.]|nr:MAG: MerR family DNA-binding transcriptional regulator [Rubrivivax sp.]